MKKSARIVIPGKVEIIQEPESYLTDPPAGWVTIQVQASGICGTDIHIFKGEYLGSYPMVPGHEFAGVITAAGSNVDQFKAGDRVAVEPNLSCGNCQSCKNNRQHFCQNWQAVGVTLPGGMATHVSVPQEAVFSIGDLSFEEGAFMEPLSCVLHGVQRLNPELGDRILLAGAGPIGLLLLRVLKQAGVAYIDVLEKRDSRRGIARASGAKAVYENVSSIPSTEYDSVIDATGVPLIMEKLVKFSRPSGKILFFGVPPKDSMISINPFLLFNRELTLISSFTSLRNSQQALLLMQSGKVRVDDLVSHRFSLDDFDKGLKLGLSNEDGVMKLMIKPN